ncbi:hypothetical protein [Brachybacterium sp. UMB0905]|nr:hypothetical protein [Brachybacterium sp. UMB0905]
MTGSSILGAQRSVDSWSPRGDLGTGARISAFQRYENLLQRR